MELFSIFILLLAAIFLWWVIKERGRNERERQVSVELVNRLFRLDERILKLEAAYEQQVPLEDARALSAAMTSPDRGHHQAAAPAPPIVVESLQSDVKLANSHKSQATIRVAATTPLPQIEVTPKAASSIGRTAVTPIPSYVNGTSIKTNGAARNQSLVARNPSDVQPEAPKLGEFGMAALLCGIAFLMDKDPELPEKASEKE